MNREDRIKRIIKNAKFKTGDKTNKGKVDDITYINGIVKFKIGKSYFQEKDLTKKRYPANNDKHGKDESGTDKV